MKTMKKLFVSLLAIAMIFALAACSLIPGFGTCTVTFYNGEEVYETVEVAKGEKLTLPKAPRGEDGKGLYGWSTINGDAEEIINPETYVVEADVSLYAVWADVYTVVINEDNGTPFTIMENVFAGTVLEQPADPVKEGFKFVEWRDAIAETTFDWTQPIQGDVTIKAMYGDGSPNRVSDYKWDFTLGHGAWCGGQGGWGRVENGIDATEMVYQTTEDGYAAWGFTLTNSLENIPEINGENGAGFGMKFLYNEGISVDAAKAKLVVAYIKPKYFPMDMYGDLNDQFRICILTSNGGKIYGYGAGFEEWGAHSAGLNKELIQADIMEDGWIRVQFKIHELSVWSEDAVIKGMSIAIVQRPSTPVMDIISVKSIELLDQEEFIDPHKIDYVTKNEWDMTKEEDANDWTGAMQNGSNTTSVTTTTDANGTSYKYSHKNEWRGVILDTAKIDISKCSGIFSATIDISGMTVTEYRLYILTDAGGNLTDNKPEDNACYYVITTPEDLGEGWTVVPNADGTVTVYYDLTKLEYWKNGTELKGLTFVTRDATTDGTIVYKSISLVDTVKTHNCETDGHVWKDATCVAPKTCEVCGATEGEADGSHSWKDATCVDPKTCEVCGATEGDPGEGHDWKDATCTAPKTCSICGETEGKALGHAWVDATCTSRVTCSACGIKKGLRLEHTYVDGVCTGCGLEQITEFTQNSWDMANADHSAQWYSAQNKNKVSPEVTYITVTEAGSVVSYLHTNGWKGIRLENTAIDMSKLTGKLSFTFTSDFAITHYRAYILTDRGGHLVENTEAKTGHAPANFYSQVEVAKIAESTVWTSTVNADGTTTVTCDLSSLGYWDQSTVLKGLCITTVADGVTGEVVYKSIELEEKETQVWDMKNAEDSAEWYATQNKDDTKTGSITVTEAGSVASYANVNAWKGMLLREQEIDISKLEGTLSFTYSTEMPITNYRIYVLSDLGGSLTHNNVPDAATALETYYVDMKLGNVANSEAWTSTKNEDGTITVTFDLTTVPFYQNGTVLKGLSIITVSGKVGDNHVTGDVLYTNIAIN